MLSLTYLSNTAMKWALIMSHFRDEEIEVLGDKATYLKSHFVKLSMRAFLRNNLPHRASVCVCGGDLKYVYVKFPFIFISKVTN